MSVPSDATGSDENVTVKSLSIVKGALFSPVFPISKAVTISPSSPDGLEKVPVSHSNAASSR